MSSHPFCLFLTILIPLFIISSSSSSSSVDHVYITNDEDGGNAVLPSELVDSICKQTSNYKFCVESIYTDPRALKAHDYFLLAYISFGLAYLNATDTLSYIKHYYLSAAAAPTTTTATVNNTNSSSSPDKEEEEEEEEEEDGISSSSTLQRCREDYERAVSALEEAYNDLNSETYFDLKVLANSASHDALHCSSQQHINFKQGKGKGKGRRRRRRRRRSGHSSNSGNIILLINSVLRKRNADLRGLCEICVVVSNQFS